MSKASYQFDMTRFPAENELDEWDGVDLFEEATGGAGTTRTDMDMDDDEDAWFIDKSASTFDEVASSVSSEQGSSVDWAEVEMSSGEEKRLSISSEEDEKRKYRSGARGSRRTKVGTGNKRHRLGGGGGAMSMALQRRALRLPMEFVETRNAGHLDKLRVFFEENFAIDAKITMGEQSSHSRGYEVALKYFALILELYPDSIVDLKRVHFGKTNELFFTATNTGTRVDSIATARDLENDEVFASLAGACGITSKEKPNFYLESLVNDADAPLSESAVSSIRQMESKVQQQEALARIEAQLWGKWTFEVTNGRPIVVAASFCRKMKEFMAVPIPR